MKRLNVHFVVLAVGSAAFLYEFSETTVSGSGDRALLEIWALSRRLTLLAYYAVFATIVMGHGMLAGQRRGRWDGSRSDAAESEART